MAVRKCANSAQKATLYTGQIDIDPILSRLGELFEALSHYELDFADVRGQKTSKRAIMCAAAAQHNILMLGPPSGGELEHMKKTTSRRLLPHPSAFSIGFARRTGV
jgi:magnesium chelatase family protein